MKNSKGLKVILKFQDVLFILLSTVETVIGGYKIGIQQDSYKNNNLLHFYLNNILMVSNVNVDGKKIEHK